MKRVSEDTAPARGELQMICYRDMTFCISPCKNDKCFRLLTDEVRAGARAIGLPIAQSDFRCEVMVWDPEKDDAYATNEQ